MLKGTWTLIGSVTIHLSDGFNTYIAHFTLFLYVAPTSRGVFRPEHASEVSLFISATLITYDGYIHISHFLTSTVFSKSYVYKVLLKFLQVFLSYAGTFIVIIFT